VEVTVNPVASGDGCLAVLVVRDATLRKEAERHLIAARDAAESARETQAVFLANMSHELRTPLNGILGSTQLLRRGEPLSERQARKLKIIEESGQHLLMLIDDILDLARIEKARLELNPIELELPAFLEAVCDIVRAKAEEKGLRLVYEPSGELPVLIVIDKKRLRQVLLNLLSNAIKFSDEGQVRLRVGVLPAALHAAPGAAACRLRFEVEDQGIGMNEAQLSALFQPFAQVAGQQRRQGGSGLGLAISRQLVRLMGGDIEVRSREGEGSVFSFEVEAPLPVRAPQAHAAASQPGGADALDGPQAVNGARVLLVEDNPINREIVLDLLVAAGALVSVAADGQQALELLDRQCFDVVLMDCLMPVMDGYAATRALRQRAGLDALPVIALTANAMVGDRDKALAAGMNDHLAKPIKVEELFATLARWIRPAGAEGDAGSVRLASSSHCERR
jgi:signal transduction histidine kinase/CheY-like chemotaxis protein